MAERDHNHTRLYDQNITNVIMWNDIASVYIQKNWALFVVEPHKVTSQNATPSLSVHHNEYDGSIISYHTQGVKRKVASSGYSLLW